MIEMKKKLINSWQGGENEKIDLTNLNIDGYKIQNKHATFFGERYEKIFKPLTGLSLYKILTNEEVIICSKIIKNHVENIKKNNSKLFEFETKEIENFQIMLEIYGNNGFSLYSWY